MELLSVIRRWALRDQLSIREIARRTGLSRNTIRKYLRGDVVEPEFKLPERPSKLDAFAVKLSAWLKQEAGKSRKQRRTVKQLHADLVALGFEGSYGRVAAFSRSWKERRQREQQIERPRHLRSPGIPAWRGLSVRLERGLRGYWRRAGEAAGSAFQAVLQPRLSRPGLSAADARDAVRRAFPCVPGARRRAAARHLRQHAHGGRSGRHRQKARDQHALCRHGLALLFDTDFCNPASGWEKGQVEKNVQDARRRLWQAMPRFATLAELNDWLEQRCQALWREIPHGSQEGSVFDAWEGEAQSLMPPGSPFDGFVECGKRVSPTCLIHFDRNRLQRACVVRQPSCQPSGLSRSACGRGRGAGHLRTRAAH